MHQSFEKFKNRLENQEIKKIWDHHIGVKKKFFDYFYSELLEFDNPKILEFGVRHGVSTSLFLDICNQKNGYLYSVDVNDYSNKFESSKWKFICSKDTNFHKVDSEIPDEFDIIFLDTIHKAEHVSSVFYHYYKKLKTKGIFIIDDISWLPYIKDNKYDNFFKEVNNKETFEKLLEIYFNNVDKFIINFNFCDTGVAKIIKLKDEDLNPAKKLHSRELSIKNLLRKLYINFKN